VLVGYAWVSGAALWIGVPEVARGSNLAELLDVVGPVGVGVGVSFIAFLVGSLSDDLVEIGLGLRGARAFTTDSNIIPAFMVITRMEGSVRAELERLEALIDKANAEVLLRVSLLPPLIVAAAAGTQERWYWAAAGLITGGALMLQSWWRLGELRKNLRSSEELRRGLEEMVVPDAQRHLDEVAQRHQEEQQQREAEERDEERKREAEQQRRDAEYREQLEREEEEEGRLRGLKGDGRLDSAQAQRLAGLQERRETREQRAQQARERAKQVMEAYTERLEALKAETAQAKDEGTAESVRSRVRRRLGWSR